MPFPNNSPRSISSAGDVSDVLDNPQNLSENVKGLHATMTDLDIEAASKTEAAEEELAVAAAKSHNKGSGKTAIENAFERGSPSKAPPSSC